MNRSKPQEWTTAPAFHVSGSTVVGVLEYVMKRTRLALVFVLAGAVCAAPAAAAGTEPAARRGTPLSQYARVAWTEKDGLPSSLIWAIAQDRSGYIWLGTDAGLVRFDGVRFVIWNSPDEFPISTVRALLASRDGSLWIGLESGGIARLKNGHLTHYHTGVPERVVTFLEDHEGTIWAGGFVGLSTFENERWQPVDAAEKLPQHLAVTILYEDRLQTVWLRSSRAVFYRPVGAKSFVEALPTAPVGSIRSLVEAPGGMAIVTAGPRVRYLNGIDVPELEALKPVTVWRSLKDRHESLWVSTLGQGVLRLSNFESPNGPTIESLSGPQQLSSDVIRSMLEDREGNIWVGTQNGLNRLTESPAVEMLDAREPLAALRAVTKGRDGSIWVGSANGLYRVTGRTVRRFSQADGLVGTAVAALHCDQDGTLYIATDVGAVMTFDGSHFRQLPLARRGDTSEFQTMATDRDGGLWLGGYTGAFLWKDGALTAFEMPELRDGFVLASLGDRQGRVWLGFADGSLVAYDHGRFVTYSEREGWLGGSVTAIAEDSRGTIWVGSARGLSRFDGRQFQSITVRNGLPGDSVRAIVGDEQDDLWFGIGSGVVRLAAGEFDRALADSAYRVRYSLYDAFDGLRGAPMSVRGYPTAVLGTGGEVWIGTTDGLAVIDSKLRKASSVPTVHIERLVANDRAVDLLAPGVLPALTSRIQIDYTGLSFAAPQQLLFRYMLEGFDRTWVNAGQGRQAFYTNLPPRNYRFKVVASNGRSSDESSAFVDFTIAPAFYQTPIFYVACAAFSLLALATLWQVRAKQVQRRMSMVFAERTRVAREIHDTLLQSLVGVAVQFQELAHEVIYVPEAAKARCDRLRKLIELYVREARQSIWDLRSPVLEARELAGVLRELGESITGDAIRFVFKVTGAPPFRAPRVEEALLRAGQEAISNAVRHASPTQVSVELRYLPEVIVLRVVDDGHGFDTAAPSHSIEEHHWGLATMEERVREIRGELRLTSRPGEGTTVEIVAPLGPNTKAR